MAKNRCKLSSEAPTTLNLPGWKVTDRGMKELAGLKGLQSLNLAATKVTDAGLKELATLKGLQILDLRNTKGTGAGLSEFAGWKLRDDGSSDLSCQIVPIGCTLYPLRAV